MPTLPLPTRALTTAFLSGALCVAAQADTLVDIYELALENDAQLKAQIAQHNADIELEKLALAPLCLRRVLATHLRIRKTTAPAPTSSLSSRRAVLQYSIRLM